MAGTVEPIPEGYHTITPHIVVKGAAEAIEFYKKAFGAEELFRMSGPDGDSVVHTELKIGDSVIMMCEEFPDMGSKGPASIGGTPVTMHLYVADADGAFKRAVEAGATELMPLQNMFWGDLYGVVTDPFGHQWAIASRVEALTAEEIGKRAAEAFAKGPGCDCGCGESA